MIRKNLEIKDIDRISEILDICDTIRLGLHDEIYPYIVPLSYGHSIVNGNIEIYIHGAFKGKKHDLIAKNNNVCVEADYIRNYELTNLSATSKYASVIGYGNISEITNESQKIAALKNLAKHCGFENLEINQQLLKSTKVYRIILKHVSAKSNIDEILKP